jgi:imidazolonepropionase-like amidohydrolase
MSLTLIRAGRVVADQAGADAVLVRDERIEAVGAASDLAGAARPDAVIDLGDLCLAPGFIDTHVHVTGNGTAAAPQDMQRDTQEVLLLQAADNALAALREGITTMRDCGARNPVIFAFREAAARGVIAAPNLLATGAALTRTGGHGHWWGLEADSPDEVRKAVRAQSKAGADALKVMVDGGIDLGRHLPGLLYFDAQQLRLAVEEARDWGMGVAAHCLTAAGVRSAVEAGVQSVEHAIFYEQELDDARYDPEVGAAMAEGGIFVNPGPAFAYELLSDPRMETAFPRNARLFHRRLDDDARMRQDGVRLVAGTDAGWYATPFGRFALVPELFVERVGMSAREAFDACTRVAADALGLARETGTIEPGKRADLVALDGDPRDDVRAMRDVRMTMVRGRVCHQTGGATRRPAGAAPMQA